MDGAKFYLQDQTGKVLVDSYSAEYDLPESPPRVVDGAHIAPLMGTGASDQELLQYVQKAGVNQLAGKMEHWLDEARARWTIPNTSREGRLCWRLPARCRRRCRAGRTFPGNIPAALIDKIMASPPLADPQKEAQRQKFLQQIRDTGTVPMPPVSSLCLFGHGPLPVARISDSARAGVSRDRHLRGESGTRVTRMTGT